MQGDNFVFIGIVFVGFQVEPFAQFAEGIVEGVSQPFDELPCSELVVASAPATWFQFVVFLFEDPFVGFAELVAGVEVEIPLFVFLLLIFLLFSAQTALDEQHVGVEVNVLTASLYLVEYGLEVWLEGFEANEVTATENSFNKLAFGQNWVGGGDSVFCDIFAAGGSFEVDIQEFVDKLVEGHWVAVSQLSDNPVGLWAAQFEHIS